MKGEKTRMSVKRHPFVTLLLALLLVACSANSSSAPPKSASTASSAPFVTAFPGSTRNLDKVDEVFLRLLLIYQTQGLDAAKLFARDQGLITAKEEVRVTLVLDSDDPAVVDGTALAVGRLGGRVTATFGNQIELIVPAQTLLEYGKQANKPTFFADLADFGHVKDIRRTPLAEPMATLTPPVSTATAARSSGKSEGIMLTGADKWQAAGITGKGVRIGIVDVGFNRYQQFLSDLKYTARSFRSDGAFEDEKTDSENVHGTACAEIVHEMAPDAELFLARIDTAGSFVMAVNWLVSTVGVSVITASVGTVGFSPPNGTNLQSQAVDKAKAAGVFFAVSAGNDASGEIGSDSGEGHFGAPFTDTDGDGFHDFPGAKNTNGLTVRVRREQTVRIVLNWDDWKQPHVNYDLYLFDSTGQEVGRSTIDQKRTGKDPVEFISQTLKVGMYTLKVKKISPNDPDLPFNIFFRGVQLEQSTAIGSLSIPADAKGAVTVAAINVQTETVEGFSSRGPTFDGRKKPDIGAPDNTLSSAYASVGEKSFSGTSAASPHVGGAAALYRQAFPDATPDAVFGFFAEHAAMPKGSQTGENITGVGRLNLGAVPPGASTKPLPARGTPIPRPERPLPADASATGVIFSDSYTTPTSGLPAQGYVSGEYRLSVPTGQRLTLPYPQTVSAARVVYTVTARTISGGDTSGMGMLIGQQEDDAYYLFVVSADRQYSIAEKRNGSLHMIQRWTANAAIAKTGDTNTLRVEITDMQALFSVNGTLLTTVTLPNPPTGRFGLIGLAGESGPTEIAFSGYTVTLPR